jgi:hypothetical protein
MKTLINAVEEWIDLRIFASSKNAIFEAKFNEMEKIHIRDANRIAELERRVLELRGSMTDPETLDLNSRLAVVEGRIQFYLDSPSPESDGEESTVTELSMRLDDVDSRLDDLECSMEHKTDSDEVETMVESGIEDLDFPDTYAIEVMIDDALETKVMDAVKAELDATDFKITVER